MPLLLVVFGPALAAVLLALLPQNRLSRWVVAVPAAACVYLASQAFAQTPVAVDLPWVPSLGISLSLQLDGLGLLSFESVVNRDYPVVFANLYIFGLLGLLINLLSDLTYTWIDPRIDFESRSA